MDAELIGEEPAILSGEWCRIFGHSDPRLFSLPVLSYHWDDRSKLARDAGYLASLAERVLEALADGLNEIHGTDFGTEYWRLLFGYWILQFVTVLWDRWEVLQSAVRSYPEIRTRIMTVPDHYAVPNGTADATRLFWQDAWNEHLFSSIVMHRTQLLFAEAVDPSRQPSSFIDPSTTFSRLKKMRNHVPFLERCKNWYKKTRLRQAKWVIGAGGLPADIVRQLSQSLNRAPYAWPFPEEPMVPLASDKRIWRLELNGSNHFEELLSELLPKYLPKVFLEGYSKLRVIARRFFPRHTVSGAFTLNAHFHSTVFKFWIAEQRERGAILATAQHGGGAFHPLNSATEYEKRVSDIHGVTGNKNADAPNTVCVGRLNQKLIPHARSQSGYMLVLQGLMPRYAFEIRSMPIAGQILSYFDDQFTFYSKLSTKVRSHTRIRIYPKGDYGWNQLDRWLHAFPDVNLDLGESRLESMIRGARLVVSTYNATTFNETLSANIPTVIFWNPNLWEISAEAEYYFAKLQEVKVFHVSPESASRHICGVWKNVQEWWRSSAVQQAREEYCDAFAKSDLEGLGRLVTALNQGSQ